MKKKIISEEIPAPKKVGVFWIPKKRGVVRHPSLQKVPINSSQQFKLLFVCFRTVGDKLSFHPVFWGRISIQNGEQNLFRCRIKERLWEVFLEESYHCGQRWSVLGGDVGGRCWAEVKSLVEMWGWIMASLASSWWERTCLLKIKKTREVRYKLLAQSINSVGNEIYRMSRSAHFLKLT